MHVPYDEHKDTEEHSKVVLELVRSQSKGDISHMTVDALSFVTYDAFFCYCFLKTFFICYCFSENVFVFVINAVFIFFCFFKRGYIINYGYY